MNKSNNLHYILELLNKKQKRAIYKKAFGREFDANDRKQLPLPLDLATKVALNHLLGICAFPR
jgi:hypothetical protein